MVEENEEENFLYRLSVFYLLPMVILAILGLIGTPISGWIYPPAQSIFAFMLVLAVAMFVFLLIFGIVWFFWILMSPVSEKESEGQIK